MSESQGKSVLCQGRIVWTSGSLFEGRPKLDFNTKQPKMNTKTGQPMKEYGFGLAVPKSVLGQSGPGEPGEVWSAMYEQAYLIYPSRQLPPAFAMKFKDGDGIDDKGAQFNLREGYGGCIVLACTTSLPIKYFKFENGANVLVNEGIKCGDYVNVQLNIKAHGPIGQGKPGLYLNPMAVQLIGYGKEIINTPSGDAMFGVQAPQVPQGASATPMAPSSFPMQSVQPQQFAPQFGQPQQFQQPQQFAPVPQQQFAPAPNWNVVPPQFQAPSVEQPQNSAPQQQGFPAPQQVPQMPGFPPLPQ